MEISWIAILFVWIVNREIFYTLIIISILPLMPISSCRTGYYEDINGRCVVCPPGTFSNNCSEICPNGTYGLKCAHACSCTDCDPVSGCPMLDSISLEEIVSVTSTDVPPAEGPTPAFNSHMLLIVILAVILTMLGCNFAATMVLLLRFSTKFNSQQHQDITPKELTTRGTIEEIEMSPDAYESPIIPTERQEMRVYTELH